MKTVVRETCARQILSIADRFEQLAATAPRAYLAVYLSWDVEPVAALKKRASAIGLKQFCSTYGALDNSFVAANAFTDEAWELYNSLRELIFRIQAARCFATTKNRPSTPTCEKFCKNGCQAENNKLGFAKPCVGSFMSTLERPGSNGCKPYPFDDRNLDHSPDQVLFFFNAYDSLCKFLRKWLPSTFSPTSEPGYNPFIWSWMDFDSAVSWCPTKPIRAIDVDSLDSYSLGVVEPRRHFVCQTRTHRIYAATGIACGDLPGIQRVMRRFGGFSPEYISGLEWSPADVFPVIEESVAASIDPTRDPEDVLHEKWAEWMLPNKAEVPKFIDSRSPPNAKFLPPQYDNERDLQFDKWIYETKKKSTWPELMTELEDVGPANEWPPITSYPALLTRIKRYSESVLGKAYVNGTPGNPKNIEKSLRKRARG